MSTGTFCTCKPQDRNKWVVIHRHCNYSAFNGYRRTVSDYSLVGCTVCRHMWRTRSRYVYSLDDVTTGQLKQVWGVTR